VKVAILDLHWLGKKTTPGLHDSHRRHIARHLDSETNLCRLTVAGLDDEALS
jgi:hypothetical protein